MKNNNNSYHNIVNKLPKWDVLAWIPTILLIALFFSLQSTPVAHANSITVSSINDNLTVDTVCTLREAIRNANLADGGASIGSGATVGGGCAVGDGTGSDTITVPAGTYLLDLIAEGDLDIIDDIIINGAGAGVTIIDGNLTDRVIHTHNSANVDLNNLTIQHGQIGTVAGADSGNGGGIYRQSSGNMTLSHVSILNNEAGHRGGGLANESDSGTVTLTNCTISGNASRYGGGLVSAPSGAITTIITDCTFSNNTASLLGGGVNVHAGTVTVNSSTFTGNSSPEYGGGIASQATLNINNSTISGNSAVNAGGGIYTSFDGATTISNSTIVNTTSGSGLYITFGNAPTVVINNSIISSNTARNCAGNITGTTLSGNNNLDYHATFTNECGFTLTTAPLLDTLADNGGDTQTHALLFGSPAIDAGDNNICTGILSTDQRGMARQDGDANGATDACDIGAYESGTMQCSIASGNSYSFATQSNIGFFINSETDLDCLYVEEMPINHPNATGNEGTHLNTGKFWRLEALQTDKITPATTFNLDLTLPFATADDPTRACKWLEGIGPGFGWDCFGNMMPTTYILNSSVTREDITTLSEWAVGESVGPTAVSLQSITTTTQPIGWVVLLFSALMLTMGGVWLRRVRR